MQLNALVPPPVVKPMTTVQPVVTAPAYAAAQSTTAVVSKAMTAQAAIPVGRSDGSRDTQSRTNTGQAVDTAANAVHAQTNGMAARRRGALLDISV